jgi:hypothetical protein
MVCIFMVISNTLEPKFAALAAASQPACPAPTTIISYSGNIGRQRYARERDFRWQVVKAFVPRGTKISIVNPKLSGNTIKKIRPLLEALSAGLQNRILI